MRFIHNKTNKLCIFSHLWVLKKRLDTLVINSWYLLALLMTVVKRQLKFLFLFPLVHGLRNKLRCVRKETEIMSLGQISQEVFTGKL